MKLTSTSVVKNVSHFILNLFGIYSYKYIAQIKSELNFDIETNVAR